MIDINAFVGDLVESYKAPQGARLGVEAPRAPQKRRSSYDRRSGDENEPFLRNNSIRDVAKFSQSDVETLGGELETVDVEVTNLVTAVMQQRWEHINLRHTSEPSKKSVKLAVSTRKRLPPNRVFRGLPGDSRNRTVDAIRAIAAEHTGCIVDNNMRDKPEHMKATTSRDDGNILAGYQYVTYVEEAE